MKKILPTAKPLIISYGHHTYPLSIAASQSNYLNWFYSITYN